MFVSMIKDPHPVVLNIKSIVTNLRQELHSNGSSFHTFTWVAVPVFDVALDHPVFMYHTFSFGNKDSRYLRYYHCNSYAYWQG